MKIENCNLVSFNFSQEFTLDIRLCNSFDGEDIPPLICQGVSHFKFSTAADLFDPDLLPMYIVELSISRIAIEDLDRILARIDFGFQGFHDAKLEMKYLLEIHGGEVDIIAICHDINNYKQFI